MPQWPRWNLPSPRLHRKSCRPGSSWWSENLSSHTFSRTRSFSTRKCLSISRSRTITLTVRRSSVTRTIYSSTWHRALLVHARVTQPNSLRTLNHHLRQRLHLQVPLLWRSHSACHPWTPTRMHFQTIVSLSQPAIFYQQRSSYSNNRCHPQIRIKLNNQTCPKLNCQLRLQLMSFNCILKDPVTQSWNPQQKPPSSRKRRRNSH